METSVADIGACAEHLLTLNPDPVPRHRLATLLDRRAGTSLLMMSEHVQRVSSAPLGAPVHGAAGHCLERLALRMHTLGLEHRSVCVVRLNDHLECLLRGQMRYLDRPEVNDRWETGIELFTAASIALTAPRRRVLQPVRRKWIALTEGAFRSGTYDARAEIDIHRSTTGASVAHRYLRLHNKYSVRLLAHDATPALLRRVYFDWLTQRSHLLYLTAAPARDPADVPNRRISAWLHTQELLSLYPEWAAFFARHAASLMCLRNSDGLWDFGARISGDAAFPLSESWRRPYARTIDWSVRVLTLLDRYANGVSGSSSADKF